MARWTVLAVVGFYVVCVLNLLYLRSSNPLFTTVQIQRRIEALLASQSYEKRQTFAPLAQIPKHLQHAVVAAEDYSFYDHNGIDWPELQKVWRERRRGGRLRGGSTITQQLVKNLFLTTHRSVIRKAAEFTLAPAAEWVLPKSRILELYLNVIEWGPGIYGAQEASRYHYNVAVSQLTREQAARLAACIPAPRSRKPEWMDQYSAEILERMARREW